MHIMRYVAGFFLLLTVLELLEIFVRPPEPPGSEKRGNAADPAEPLQRRTAV